MKYRKDLKSGNKLSVLGFGCMRFPRGLNTRIDVDKAEKLILSAIDKGVNYFDTAYIYGGSEDVLGEVFIRNKGIRNKIYIATKLPFYQCKTYDDFDMIFNEQLKRLNTDYIDYYLIHNISTVSSYDKLCKLGIEKWISEKKLSGKIKNIGFSFHGIQSEFLALLNVYNWDFCQIQYNYVNENYQAGTKGLIEAYKKGLSVIIMEPLLGGRLAYGLPKKAVKLLKDNNDITPASWALKWLWNKIEVTVVLSGMNSEEQLIDNVKTASNSDINIMTENELGVIEKVVSYFKEGYKIPCTGCNYCMPCPRGVNIPGCFAAYNMSYVASYITGMAQYLTSTGASNPEKNYTGRKCVKCGKCEKKCPQKIEIIKNLEIVTKRMEPFWFNTVMKIFNKFR